ncbi:M15 family metallopeptidase [Cohnella yongneupensis]|uniref:M15 family metallopeptidase n=1 Tax=Cohnella yongneupensis TaxID=425006 RepID=A0ABW0QW71_9BACL
MPETQTRAMNPSTLPAPAKRTRSSANRHIKWLTRAVLTVAAGYILIQTGFANRWIPIEWFRDVPEVTQLNPIVADNADKLVALSLDKGIDVLITDDYRSVTAQDALYRQGRSDGGAIVTNAKGGESYHNYGLAIDFALLTPEGKAIWDLNYDGNGNGRADWMEVVAIAKRLGFSWGGDWKSFPDYPHLQMDFGYSIRELQGGWRPPAKPEQLADQSSANVKLTGQ